MLDEICEPNIIQESVEKHVTSKSKKKNLLIGKSEMKGSEINAKCRKEYIKKAKQKIKNSNPTSDKWNENEKVSKVYKVSNISM